MNNHEHVRARLLEKYGANEVGTWRINGEDPNCDWGGHHHEPYLDTVSGTYRNVVNYALSLGGFFNWGAGGSITKIGNSLEVKNVDPTPVQVREESVQRKFAIERIREILSSIEFMDRKFLVMEKGDGFLLQMSYMEEDVDNPGSGPVEQKTRKWYASPFMTESELVETVWAMVCRSQMHVTAEHFKYKGRRVYSPHFDINARIEMCDANRFDCRAPIKPEPK